MKACVFYPRFYHTEMVNAVKSSSRYFENRQCEYFPCHDMEGDFNCLFCYCPLYDYDDCPGSGEYKNRNGRRIKVCTKCSFPHKAENYEKILEFLKSKGK